MESANCHPVLTRIGVPISQEVMEKVHAISYIGRKLCTKLLGPPKKTWEIANALSSPLDWSDLRVNGKIMNTCDNVFLWRINQVFAGPRRA